MGLQPECLNCESKIPCGFIGNGRCAMCPDILMCSPVTLVRGYRECTTPIDTVTNLPSKCNLNKRILSYKQYPTHTEVRCGRCGVLGRVRSFEIQESVFTCTRCGLRIENVGRKDLAPPGNEAVFKSW